MRQEKTPPEIEPTEKKHGCFRQGCSTLFVAGVLIISGLYFMSMVGEVENETASRCVPASDQLVQAVGSGLEEGVAMNDSFIVKSEESRDGNTPWFLAGALQVGEVQTTGVWMTTNINEEGVYIGRGLIYAVDEVAREFSDWGYAGDTDWNITMTYDGAREAEACV